MKIKRKGITAMSRGEKDEPAHLLPQQAVLWRKRLPAQSLPGPVAASLSEASQDVHTPREDALTPGPRERGGMGSAVSGSRDELACRIPGQEAGRREPSAAAAWLPGHGLLQGAACLVTFNRGLCRLGLKGGIKCAVSQISPSLLCSPQNRVAEPVRRAPLQLAADTVSGSAGGHALRMLGPVRSLARQALVGPAYFAHFLS